jgi:hypothetical protein
MPRTVYVDGLAAADLDEKRWVRRSKLTSNTRLVCFVALLVVAWLAFGTRSLGAFWIFLPAMTFAGLVIAHDRILHREARAARVRRFYEDGLARLEDRWAGLGQTGDQYRDPNHPYAEDLDVFGTGSLFELLATTKTAPGNDRLASWLLEAADADTICRRQAAVQELRPRLDLRLKMTLAGDESGSAIQQAVLESWAAAPAKPLPSSISTLATGASSLSLIGLALWTLTDAGPVPFVAALILQSILALTIRGRVAPVLAAAETPVQSLSRTASLLACVESENYQAALLRQRRAELETTGRTPSQELESLRRLVDRRDVRANQFFAPIAALLMWGTHTALALEKWRTRCGPRLSIWIEAAGEIEALCALASFAYEHPDDAFPEIVESEAIFDGTALGHPLLPTGRSIRNDLRLSVSAMQPQGLVMSGSNMSGKSTMLRTVGCNTILALAGAPVRATRLRISPLRIAASIRIVDSLRDGQSHFMAEIMRLRQVVDISRGEEPALFLLDEILHGTNSHDRRIGAEAVIKGLIAEGALGIVTTHDLALTKIVHGSDGKLDNVHFEDHLEAGAMHFDYTLRKGIVEKSNALALMRSIGLDI